MGISALIGGLIESLGVGASTAGIIGSGLATGLEGAAIGAGTSALTGGKPLKGAELGFLGGAGAGLGPAIGAGLGIGSTAGSALGGAAGGALGGAATGTNPLTGALEGGLAGALGAGTGLIGGGDGAVPSSVPITGPVLGAASGGGGVGFTAPVSVAPLGDVSGGIGLNEDATGLAGIGLEGKPTASGPVQAAATGAPGAGGSTALAAPNSAAPASNPAPASKGGLFGSNLSLRDALAVGGLGLSATKANAKLPGEVPLTTTAANLGTQGSNLTGYLTSGTLPPGMQEGITSALNSAKATIRSRFANMGMSGQPAEAQALAQAEQQAATEGPQIAVQLLNSGLTASNMSAELYNMILQNSLNQDRELGSAVSNFATAMAGGNPLAKAA